MATMAMKKTELSKDVQTALDNISSNNAYKRTREPEYNFNMSYYLGEQWVNYRASSALIQKVEAPNSTLHTYNVITPIVNTITAFIATMRPYIASEPKTNESDDINSAKVSTSVLKSELWQKNDMQLNLLRMIPALSAFNYLILHPYFNDNVGKEYKADDINALFPGVWQPDETRREGCAEIDIITPFEFYHDMNATRMEDCEWAAIKKIRTKEYIKTRWGKEVKGDKTNNMRISTTFEQFKRSVERDSGSIQPEGAIVWEYYRKKCPEYPQGQLLIFTDDGEKLYEGTLPWGLDKENILPFVKVDWNAVLGSFTGVPPLTYARPLQKEINLSYGQFLKYKQNYMFPPLLVPSDSGVTEQDFTNRPNEMVKFTPSMANDRGGAPAYMQPPPFNGQFIEHIYRLETQIEKIMGVGAASMGNVPQGTRSGRAISLLQSASDTRMTQLQINLEEALSKLGRIFLIIVENTYDIPRMISIVGETSISEIRDFTGDMINGNNKTNIRLKVALPLNKQSAIDVVNTWWTNGLIPKDKYGMRMAHQMLDLESFSPFASDTLNEEQAKFENGLLDEAQMGEDIPEMIIDPNSGEEINTGRMVKAGMERNEWDDDYAHLEVHERRQKEISFIILCKKNPKVKEAYALHKEKHRAAIVAKENLAAGIAVPGNEMPSAPMQPDPLAAAGMPPMPQGDELPPMPEGMEGMENIGAMEGMEGMV